MILGIESSEKIYWGENLKTTYTYGSKILIYGREHIRFENNLVPSGEIIQEWSSDYHYQFSRKLSGLPLLKRKQTYLVTFQMDLVPDESILIRVVFFNRYKKDIKNVTAKGKSISFTYPEEAYFYKIQLVSAGMISLDFYHLTIKEVQDTSYGGD